MGIIGKRRRKSPGKPAVPPLYATDYAKPLVRKTDREGEEITCRKPGDLPERDLCSAFVEKEDAGIGYVFQSRSP